MDKIPILRIGVVVTLAFLIAAVNVPLFASAVTIGTTWYEITYGTAPGAASGCGGLSCSPTTNPASDQTNTSPWTITGPATITIQDIGDIGDRFTVSDNGVAIGTTSAPVGTGNPCGFDIGCARANANYSSGSFQLGAGAHSITISVIQNAPGTTSGNAAFLISAPGVTGVPAPPSVLLLGTAMLAMLGWWRWRTVRAS